MGFSEVVSSLGAVLRLMRDIRRNILKTAPDVLVLADSPDFHLPLIKSLRRTGYKGRIVYISPPSVWAWRKYRVRSLVSYVDICLPLFRFEHDFLASEGCDSRWKGHPLVEEFSDIKTDCDKVFEGIKGTVRPKKGETVVALLPGSRMSEIEPLYPVLSGLYKIMEARGAHPVFSVAPGLSERARNFLMKNLASAGQCYYEGSGRDIMGVSEVVAGSSGTATAEALLLRRYMVVLYKLRTFTYIVGRALLHGVKFAIPNLLAGEYFYPELLQRDANAQNAARAVSEWLDMDSDARAIHLAKMEELAGLMGCSGVYDFWAEEILGVLY
jgi:lipid-A-disaccharide synthase